MGGEIKKLEREKKMLEELLAKANAERLQNEEELSRLKVVQDEARCKEERRKKAELEAAKAKAEKEAQGVVEKERQKLEEERRLMQLEEEKLKALEARTEEDEGRGARQAKKGKRAAKTSGARKNAHRCGENEVGARQDATRRGGG